MFCSLLYSFIIDMTVKNRLLLVPVFGRGFGFLYGILAVFTWLNSLFK